MAVHLESGHAPTDGPRFRENTAILRHKIKWKSLLFFTVTPPDNSFTVWLVLRFTSGVYHAVLIESLLLQFGRYWCTESVQDLQFILYFEFWLSEMISNHGQQQEYGKLKTVTEGTRTRCDCKSVSCMNFFFPNTNAVIGFALTMSHCSGNKHMAKLPYSSRATPS